jgi:hypothetical protein
MPRTSPSGLLSRGTESSQTLLLEEDGFEPSVPGQENVKSRALIRSDRGCHPRGPADKKPCGDRPEVARRHLKAGTSRRGALQNAAALQLPTSRLRCCRISRRRRSSRWRTNIEKTGEDAYRLTMAVAERRIPGGCAVDATCRIEQAEQTIRKGSDNQIDRPRVLEVRIQSPPAASRVRTSLHPIGLTQPSRGRLGLELRRATAGLQPKPAIIALGRSCIARGTGSSNPFPSTSESCANLNPSSGCRIFHLATGRAGRLCRRIRFRRVSR